VPITNWFDDPDAVGNELFGGGERVGRVTTSNARRLGIELGREPIRAA
jgi:hypothetical protein